LDYEKRDVLKDRGDSGYRNCQRSSERITVLLEPVILVM